MPLALKEPIPGNVKRPHIDSILGRYKAEEFISLLKKWADLSGNKRLLKTDLCEEAFGQDQILFSLPNKDLCIFGIDICEETVKRADITKELHGHTHNYIRADVRNLPFCNDSFDIVFSGSTLDHFTSEDDFIISITELKRVVKSAGTIIIALNNKGNTNFYFWLKAGRFFKVIPYPVQFYSLSRAKEILEGLGLTVLDEEAIVHIISPLNTILLFFRRFIDSHIIDRLAAKCVSLFRWLEKRKMIKYNTGWFIALRCIKTGD